MPFAEGTSVTVPTENGGQIGTVRGFENGKYRVEVDNKIVEADENEVQEFVIQMMNKRRIVMPNVGK